MFNCVREECLSRQDCRALVMCKGMKERKNERGAFVEEW